MTPLVITPKDISRFWSKVEIKKPNQCWHFHGTMDGHGYGVFSIMGRSGISIAAHRFVFILFTGIVPVGKDVCHRCDNPKCVNPFHLWEGTRKQNLQDMAKKNRSNHGVKNWNSKLTEPQVKAMRSEYDGEWGSISRLAKKYGVGHSVVSEIINKKAWTRV